MVCVVLVTNVWSRVKLSLKLLVSFVSHGQCLLVFVFVCKFVLERHATCADCFSVARRVVSNTLKPIIRSRVNHHSLFTFRCRQLSRVAHFARFAVHRRSFFHSRNLCGYISSHGRPDAAACHKVSLALSMPTGILHPIQRCHGKVRRLVWLFHSL